MNYRKSIRGWKCLPRPRTVHGLAARTTRRGRSKGMLVWSLVPPDGPLKALRAPATRKAVLEELTRIISKD